MTMPHCQRKGYGRMLIDFSYMLSKVRDLGMAQIFYPMSLPG